MANLKAGDILWNRLILGVAMPLVAVQCILNRV
jgi:hypothetical protein